MPDLRLTSIRVLNLWQSLLFANKATVVQRLDSNIHWVIPLFLIARTCWVVIYPVNWGLFSKVPKLYGPTPGATIPSPRLIKNMLKDRFLNKSGLQFENWLFQAQKVLGTIEKLATRSSTVAGVIHARTPTTIKQD